jgi:hypothetical protein
MRSSVSHIGTTWKVQETGTNSMTLSLFLSVCYNIMMASAGIVKREILMAFDAENGKFCNVKK